MGEEEAEPGPDLFMYMIAVAEVLVIQAAFYHSKGGFPLLLFLEKFPYRVKFYTKPRAGRPLILAETPA